MSTATIEPEASAATQVVVGSPYSLGMMSNGEIMALASASTADSTDPVDQALTSTLVRNYPSHEVPVCDAADADPATPDRKYSVTRLRDFTEPDGTVHDVVVMRGDLDSMLSAVKIGRQSRSVVRRRGNVAIRRGWRPLAVATAPVDSDDKVGSFALQGFVALTTDPAKASVTESIGSESAQWVRVNVWSPSLRIQHWSNVILIVTLSITGFFIMDPFFGVSSTANPPAAYTGFGMGWVRMVHFTAAFCWLVVGLLRIWSAFTSSDRYLRWSSMWPLKSKQDWKYLGQQLLHYTFVKTESPVYLGHNPLQQLTYTGVYVLCGFQMLIGLVLFSLPFANDNVFWHFLCTPIYWWGIAPLRLVHAIVMFLLWAFVIGHVYLVFRADATERHGGLSAMINGGVWVMKGTKPVDAPIVE